MDETPALRTSVLFVSRNEIEPLRRSLASVEASTGRASIEVIVVDNGSTDGTAQLDTEFPSASFLRLPKNFGHTKAFNIGMRTAKGDYVLLAQPGTEFPAPAISLLTAYLESDNDAAAVCPYIPFAYRLPTADELYAEWKKAGALHVVSLVDEGDAAPVDYPRGAPMLVRRRLLAGLRFFDERYGDSGYDLDLCRQLRSAGKRIIVLPDIRVEIPARVRENVDPMESVDELNAVARYSGKYFGTWAGVKVRLVAALHVLGKAVRFERPGYNLSRLTGVISGRKIDGEQEP